jgi:hypothetical protein
MELLNLLCQIALKGRMDEQWTKQDHGFSASIAASDLRTAVHAGHRDSRVTARFVPCVKWITAEGKKIGGGMDRADLTVPT